MYRKTELTKAFLTAVPVGHDQFHRPLEFIGNGSAISKMGHLTESGNHITPAALAGVASELIAPTMAPQSKLLIPGGMQSLRYAFSIEITTTHNDGGMTIREIITGFTDRDGISPRGHIDPDMIFHINSIVEVGSSLVTNAYGQTQSLKMRSTNQLLTSLDNSASVAQRPEDIVGLQQSDIGIETGAILNDLRQSTNGQEFLSKTSNALPAYYLSDICNGLENASNTVSGFSSGSDVLSMAKDNVREKNMYISDFYSAMAKHDNDGLAGAFTFGQLDATWPRHPDFWTVTRPRNGQTLTSPLEYTEHWGGANVETSIAYSLTHAMPELLSSLMIVGAEIDIMCLGDGTTPSILVMNHTPMFDNTVFRRELEILENRILLDIVKGVMQANATTYHIHLKVSLRTNSTYNISIDGRPSIPYNAPMYCDSYVSPLIGASYDGLRNMKTGIETLCSEILPSMKTDPFGADVDQMNIQLPY